MGLHHLHALCMRPSEALGRLHVLQMSFGEYIICIGASLKDAISYDNIQKHNTQDIQWKMLHSKCMLVELYTNLKEGVNISECTFICFWYIIN